MVTHDQNQNEERICIWWTESTARRFCLIQANTQRIRAEKKYCWKVISITWESCWTIKRCLLNFMVLFGGKMKSPRFSPARFAHSTVPEHFTLVLPSLSKNLRELLKMSLFRCLERWESFLSEKTKLNQKGFDATQKRSEPETLLLRDCKFLNQISVGM